MPILVVSATGAFIVACVVCDLQNRRIPNVLTLAGVMLGLGVNIAIAGASGGLQGLAGMLVAIAILLPVFVVGGIGGGDVKMMAALGALLGVRLMVLGLVCGMIAGGVFMLVHLWRLGRIREKLESTRTMMLGAIYGRSVEPLHGPAKDPHAVALPYSVPLGLGVLLVLSVHVLTES